jgi:hypothetical protein
MNSEVELKVCEAELKKTQENLASREEQLKIV